MYREHLMLLIEALLAFRKEARVPAGSYSPATSLAADRAQSKLLALLSDLK